MDPQHLKGHGGIDTGGVPRELIEHAVRCWEAEVENARRHATRLNLLVPGILAVLGLGAFNLGWLAQGASHLQPPWVSGIARVLLIGALALFLRALLILLMVRTRSRRLPTASYKLTLLQEVESNPGALGSAEAQRLVFARTHAAYLDLQRRNSAEQARINLGQQCLLLAMVHALLAIAGYTAFGRVH